MRRSARLIHPALLLVSVAALSGCGDDPIVPDFSAVAGTWTLQTVNSLALPVDLVEDGTPFVLHSGNIVLRADGSCSNTFVTTPQGEPQKTETLNCTFTLSGTSFSYTESSITYAGTLSGSSITVNNDGNSLIYER